MTYAIRHENGRWLLDASGYAPKFTVWQNKRYKFTAKRDAERAADKCTFLSCPCKIIPISGGAK
jgi:hypothetical protein